MTTLSSDTAYYLFTRGHPDTQCPIYGDKYTYPDNVLGASTCGEQIIWWGVSGYRGKCGTQYHIGRTVILL